MNDSLNAIQIDILKKFYSRHPKKILLKKNERAKIWQNFVDKRDYDTSLNLETLVPSLKQEIDDAKNSGKNIQPAIFSECVYAQSIAEVFDLDNFETESNILRELNFEKFENSKFVDLTVRYSYSNDSKTSILIQAGGNNGVDSALIDKIKGTVAMIEFKEPYARTSEPDLPKYGEDGNLNITPEFKKEYPQFNFMLEEKINENLNIFENLGNNIHSFSAESIEYAVSENYTGEKFADLICTEDINGYLVMIPSTHVGLWATLEGELRPTGRNSYRVWTPVRLESVLESLGATIENEMVEIDIDKVKPANKRGSRELSRYKIDPMFFVRAKNVVKSNGKIRFALNSIMQNNPSITAKMNFKGLRFQKVKNFYQEMYM